MLRVRELYPWLDLVKKVNPDVYAASKALDSWLESESIAGGHIDGKQTLRIKAKLPTTIYEVEEIQDSEDEDPVPAQSQAIAPSAEPARALRQLTLPELFKPPPCASEVLGRGENRIFICQDTVPNNTNRL